MWPIYRPPQKYRCVHCYRRVENKIIEVNRNNLEGKGAGEGRNASAQSDNTLNRDKSYKNCTCVLVRFVYEVENS